VIVRRGLVTAEKPAIALPGTPLQFEGFQFDWDEESIEAQAFLARRVEMPAAKYVNKSEATTTESGELKAVLEQTINRLDQANDIRSGVLLAPDLWRAQRDQATDVRGVMRPILFAPASKPVVDLIPEMRQQRTKMAVVVDEFGGRPVW